MSINHGDNYRALHVPWCRFVWSRLCAANALSTSLGSFPLARHLRRPAWKPLPQASTGFQGQGLWCATELISSILLKATQNPVVVVTYKIPMKNIAWLAGITEIVSTSLDFSYRCFDWERTCLWCRFTFRFQISPQNTSLLWGIW